MKSKNSGSTENRGQSFSCWALGVSISVMASLSIQNAEANFWDRLANNRSHLNQLQKGNQNNVRNKSPARAPARVAKPRPPVEKGGAEVKVINQYVDTKVLFEFIDSISRGRIEGRAFSASRQKVIQYSNRSGAASGSLTIKLRNVMASSLPDHCVTLAARAIGSENVLFSVTARIYSIKNGKEVMPPMQNMKFDGEHVEDIGELVGCTLTAGGIASTGPLPSEPVETQD